MRIVRETERSPTTAEGNAHRSHAESRDGLAGAPRRSSLKARGGVQSAYAPLPARRAIGGRWAVPSAIVLYI